MIRIKPADDPRRPNRQEILNYYFNMLAEVVLFRPEDLLKGMSEAYPEIGKKHRSRTLEYKAILAEYGIPVGGNRAEMRIHDAELAEKIIKDYSEKLHKELYGEKGGVNGAVKSPKALQDFFKTRFVHGSIPKKLQLDNEKKPSKEATDRLKKYVFPYDDFAQIKKSKAKKNQDNKLDIYQFVSMLGVEVCPYCNRQFTSTIISEDKQIRPQLDHFRNKKDYPHLALCLNNLIPCCPSCNLLKHDEDLNILYPYDEGIDNSYVFRAETDDDDIVSLLTGTGEAVHTFTLTFDKNKAIPEDKKFNKKVERSIKKFALRELYSTHKGYVVDLFRQNYFLPESFFEDKKIQFDNMFESTEDVKHAMRLMDYSPEKWGERPLAKLTHDISEQIDELNTKT